MTEKTALDILWVLLCAGLVFLMQAGFLCLEAGLTRSKNAISVAVKNLADFGASTLIFWVFGFALMFGASRTGWVGTSGFFFQTHASDPWPGTFFLYQLMFCGTAVTIVSGAVAERMRFSAYLKVAILVSGLLYPLFGHWAWADGSAGGVSGWLKNAGFVDFAGSTVVHGTGAWVALAAVLAIGPRWGRFPEGRQPEEIPGSNLPTAMLGVLLLWFGWIGFNGGSALGFNQQVPGIVVNTLLAAGSGLVTAMVIGWIRLGYVNPRFLINGSLAGLVAVTAGCFALSQAGALFVGGVGAVVMLGAEGLMNRFRVDDAVGAVAVHGAAGVWGTLAVALLGRPEILGTGLSMAEQLKVQAMGTGLCFCFVFGVTWTVLKILKLFSPIRISLRQERLGLNVSEHRAGTETLNLLTAMRRQAAVGDLSLRAPVEPFTEVGRIARLYNRVLAALEKSQLREKRLAVAAAWSEAEHLRAQELQAAYQKLKQTQSMLVQSEKMAAVGQLASGVAHEVKNPLGIIRQGADFLKSSGGWTDRKQEGGRILLMIQDAVTRADRIVRGLLDFSRPSPLKIKAVPFRPLVKEALGLVNKQITEAGIQVRLICSSGLPPVNVDRNQITQVLVNVFLNAVQAMPEGGTITIRCCLDRLEGSRLLCQIQDSGSGVPEPLLTKVFDPFFTTKGPQEGTGLGLSVSRSIMEAHNGTMELKSGPDGGAVVVLLLPAAEEEEGHCEEKKTAYH